MQPDSVTQALGLFLVQVGIPAPFAVLIAVLSLFLVPALIVAVIDVQVARRERRAEVRLSPRFSARRTAQPEKHRRGRVKSLRLGAIQAAGEVFSRWVVG